MFRGSRPPNKRPSEALNVFCACSRFVFVTQDRVNPKFLYSRKRLQMKKTVIAISFLALTTSLVTVTFPTSRVRAEKGKNGPISISPITPGEDRGFVPGRMLVKFNSNVGPDHARQIIAALGARDADEIPEIGVHILTRQARWLSCMLSRVGRKWSLLNWTACCRSSR